MAVLGRPFTIISLAIFLIATILTIHVSFGNTKTADILCIESEKQALLSFKKDLVDESNRLLSWAVEDDCCKWSGILCDNSTGYVRQINLGRYMGENSVLKGKLNPSLLNLKHLTHLDLSNNDFGGVQIPSFMGSFVNMRYLILKPAGFSGLVPYQLGNLSTLRRLVLRDFYRNDKGLYVDNLHWLSSLSKLEYLDMYNVNLSKASDHWSLMINMLPNLRELDFSSCQLAHIPSLSHMTVLEKLSLSGNHFGPTIPDCVYHFSGLKDLSLGSNNFKGVISSTIGNLTSVVDLDLSFNKFEGKIPTSMGNLCNLQHIDLIYNKFGGMISEAFQSVVSEFHFANLSNLKSLAASSNSVVLRVSPDWIPPPKLIDIELKSWSLGKIPDCWIKWPMLMFVKLNNNNLTGEIPTSIGSLLSLQSLHLRNAGLSGEIPLSLQNCTELITIDFGLNELVESIPRWLGISLSNLKILGFRSNKLNGQIPLEICHLTTLQVMDISHNNLSGNIPVCFNNFQAMASKIEYGFPIYYSRWYTRDSMETMFVVKKE
ncbi:hypothetical protein FNV43_RR09573 [Rhamnella rubrinervis]|uniref:Leucine-rich repeat-containing N-terminal plant-type domain-containing protein n=1 Tax=Rhamnella rubrinervis TaxID=2594499 RepID=A0A8K0HBK8_9ROSA|nr:hypothetical protein FNV43_RR09573 [Rhamnella rubrinervis]